MTAFTHSFPSRLTTLREKKRMSKTALAKSVGVSVTCVWNWEEGNTEPREENLLQLSRALMVSRDYLISGSDVEINEIRCSDIVLSHEKSESLGDVINRAKMQIADVAGIDPARVKISLDY